MLEAIDYGYHDCGPDEQDIELLLEMLEVIDSSLPLIGRANAAKLVFAPDHQVLCESRAVQPSVYARPE